MTDESRSQLVAIVDDDRSVQSALKDLMESAGLSALCFGSAEEFLESKHRSETACLVADIRMPGMSGLELQAKLQAEGSLLPIIFVTAHGDAKMKMQAMKAGAREFLSKPFDDEVLLEKVRAALKCEQKNGVYGVKNLRIADGLLMPTITTGNSQAPPVTIGERLDEVLSFVSSSIQEGAQRYRGKSGRAGQDASEYNDQRQFRREANDEAKRFSQIGD